MSSAIPPEIISDILVRLPVKPLLRFRTVSKPWCALIDSPYFIKRHLKQSITTKSNRSFYLVGNTGTLYYLDYNAIGTPIRIEVPVTESVGVDIIGSCNGLLLLVSNDTGRNNISLLNPATQQYRVLPDAQTEYPSDPVVFTSKKFGFGYDFVYDDYKVIRVVEFTGTYYRWIGSEARIYSLKTNSWHKVDKFSSCLSSVRVWGVHLNGRLHSLVSRSKIAAFDLSTEKCDYIPLPNGMDKCYYDVVVEVFEEMLCVKADFDIWVMREYGVNDSWFKLLSISSPFVSPYTTIHPLAFSRNGEEVLLYCNGERLIWYNRERKSIMSVPFCGRYNRYCIAVCVDSLVLLDDRS